MSVTHTWRIQDPQHLVKLAKAGGGIAKVGGGIMKGIGALGGFAGKALGGLGKLLGKAGPIGLAISAIAGFGLGMAKASEIFKNVDIGAAEYAAAGIGGAVNMLTMGLIDTKTAAETAMDLGKFAKSFLPSWAGGSASDPLDDIDTTMTPEAMEAASARRKALPPPTSTQKPPVEGQPVDAKGKNQEDSGAAIATGTVSGKSLILEVTNWDQIYAQAVDDAA